MSKKWENLCNKCSLCCHEKLYFVNEKRVELYINKPCPNLNTETGLCNIYDKRLKKCKECEKVSLFKVIFSPYIPPQCAYLEWAKKHHLRIKRNISYAIIEEANS